MVFIQDLRDDWARARAGVCGCRCTCKSWEIGCKVAEAGHCWKLEEAADQKLWGDGGEHMVPNEAGNVLAARMAAVPVQDTADETGGSMDCRHGEEEECAWDWAAPMRNAQVGEDENSTTAVCRMEAGAERECSPGSS